MSPALNVQCPEPFCEQAAGLRCVSKYGVERANAHAKRFTAYYATNPIIVASDEIGCAGPECREKVKNHRWGKTKAVGWFFSREDDKAYCPKHVPEWVEEWRKKRDGITS